MFEFLKNWKKVEKLKRAPVLSDFSERIPSKSFRKRFWRYVKQAKAAGYDTIRWPDWNALTPAQIKWIEQQGCTVGSFDLDSGDTIYDICLRKPE